MLRHSALLLVLTLTLGSGRLLACGWECADQLVNTHEPACHESASTDGLAMSASAHDCAPDEADPAVATLKAGAGAPQVIAFTTVGIVTSIHAPAAASFAADRPPSLSPAACSLRSTVLRI